MMSNKADGSGSAGNGHAGGESRNDGSGSDGSKGNSNWSGDVERTLFQSGYLYEATEDIEIGYKLVGKSPNNDLEPIRKMIIPKGEILEFR